MSRAKGSIKTGGRVAGTPNIVTAEIKAVARVHGPDAIKELWRIAQNSQSDAARISAIGELLDRGYGKPKQELEHSGAIDTISKEQRDATNEAYFRSKT